MRSFPSFKQYSEEVLPSAANLPEQKDEKPLISLATELLEDPQDHQSLDQLTLESPNLAELQSDFFELLSTAVDEEELLANLSDCGKERLAYVLHHAPVSDASTGLALDILEFCAAPENSLESYDGLVLAAFELLRRAIPELLTEIDPVCRLTKLALRYGETLGPCGVYEKNDGITFKFDNLSLARSDLVGTGAILLLCEADSAVLYSALARLDDDEIRPTIQISAAVRFSKQHPITPNLFLRLLGSHGPYFDKELHRLHDLQSGVLRGRESRDFMMRHFKLGAHAAMGFWYLKQCVLGLIFGPANIGPNSTVELLAICAASGFIYWRHNLNEKVRANTLSLEHREELKSIIEATKR